MSLSSNNWFTEVIDKSGLAFSLRIKARLHEEQSAFQRIEVYDTETFGNLMVIDGCVMLTQRDNFLYHEMMSHPALFTHTNRATYSSSAAATAAPCAKYSSTSRS